MSNAEFFFNQFPIGTHLLTINRSIEVVTAHLQEKWAGSGAPWYGVATEVLAGYHYDHGNPLLDQTLNGVVSGEVRGRWSRHCIMGHYLFPLSKISVVNFGHLTVYQMPRANMYGIRIVDFGNESVGEMGGALYMLFGVPFTTKYYRGPLYEYIDKASGSYCKFSADCIDFIEDWRASDGTHRTR